MNTRIRRRTSSGKAAGQEIKIEHRFPCAGCINGCTGEKARLMRNFDGAVSGCLDSSGRTHNFINPLSLEEAEQLPCCQAVGDATSPVKLPSGATKIMYAAKLGAIPNRREDLAEGQDFVRHGNLPKSTRPPIVSQPSSSASRVTTTSKSDSPNGRGNISNWETERAAAAARLRLKNL